MNLRKCSRCHEFKPLEAFYVRKSGLQVGKPVAHCKTCACTVVKEWQHNNKERRKAYKEQHREHMKVTARARTLRNPHKYAKATRIYKYGLESVPIHNYIVAGGLCQAGCGHPAQAVDHCHTTDKVRGALCHMCNRALGNARDSVAVLEGLIGYLRSHLLRVA